MDFSPLGHPIEPDRRERLARVEWMFGYLGGRRRRVCRIRIHVLFIAVCMRELFTPTRASPRSL
jgi:hypothetical protein